MIKKEKQYWAFRISGPFVDGKPLVNVGFYAKNLTKAKEYIKSIYPTGTWIIAPSNHILQLIENEGFSHEEARIIKRRTALDFLKKRMKGE